MQLITLLTALTIYIPVSHDDGSLNQYRQMNQKLVNSGTLPESWMSE